VTLELRHPGFHAACKSRGRDVIERRLRLAEVFLRRAGLAGGARRGWLLRY